MEKGTTFSVLNKGYVKLINSMGNDEEIIDAARMSTNRSFVSWDPYRRCNKCEATWNFEPPMTCIDKLIGAQDHDAQSTYFPRGDFGTLDTLYSNQHLTPFEMCELVIEVKAPIMVFREWHRHRTQSYNEFSARYSQMPDEHYIPEQDRIQRQSTTNKQGSAEVMDNLFAQKVCAELARQQTDIYSHYESWLDEGLAKEVARLNTPVSRYSKMRAKANLRNWLGFALLRSKPNAQWEIRQYSDVVGTIIAALFPKTWDLFLEYTFHSVTFSRTEMKLVRDFYEHVINTQQINAMWDIGRRSGVSEASVKKLMAKLCQAA